MSWKLNSDFISGKTVEKKKKILVIDDEEGIRELLSVSLKMRGFEVLMACDGEEGLAQARQFRPDLILLDVMMPKMDGWEMLSHLRRDEKTKNIPVAMLTAKIEDHNFTIAREYEASEYFTKPVDLDELISFVKRYIR